MITESRFQNDAVSVKDMLVVVVCERRTGDKGAIKTTNFRNVVAFLDILLRLLGSEWFMSLFLSSCLFLQRIVYRDHDCSLSIQPGK